MTAVTGAIPAMSAPAPRARPRVLLVGTVLASAAAVMAFAGMVALYLAVRAETIAETGSWLPEGVDIPLLPGNMGLVTLAMSAVTMHWALYSIGNDDRRNTYLALGVTLVLGLAFINGMAFYFTQIGLGVSEPVGVLVYGIVGSYLAMVGAGLLFASLMALRALGGQYSARDREGIAAATLFWYVTTAMYVVVWLAIFVTK